MPAVKPSRDLILDHQFKLVVVFFEAVFLGKDLLEAIGRATYATVDKGSPAIKSRPHQNRVVITFFDLF